MVLHFSLLYINNLPDDVICNIAISADDTTPYSKYDCSVATTELASELESDLWDTVDWGRKWLVDIIAGKTQLVSFDRLITLLLLLWKWMGFVSNLLPNWIGALILPLLLKLFPRKLEPWFVLWSFFLLRLLCISIHLLYGHAWITVVMSGLVILVATWNCWISYENEYAGRLVLHLLPLLNLSHRWNVASLSLFYRY